VRSNCRECNCLAHRCTLVKHWTPAHKKLYSKKPATHLLWRQLTMVRKAIAESNIYSQKCLARRCTLVKHWTPVHKKLYSKTLASRLLWQQLPRCEVISFLRAGAQCFPAHLCARQFRFRRLLHTPWSSAVAATTSEWLSFAFLWAVRNAFQGHTCLGRVNFAWGSARAYTPTPARASATPSQPRAYGEPKFGIQEPLAAVFEYSAEQRDLHRVSRHSCSPTPTLIKPASCGKLQYQ
jgi:hypothetical protein